jgi:tetratricopeptide (TPR) repeat protein
MRGFFAKIKSNSRRISLHPQIREQRIHPRVLKLSYPTLSLLLGGCALVGFGLWKITLSTDASSSAIKRTESIPIPSNNPCGIALVPHRGNEAIDREIAHLQDEVRSSKQRSETMKRLGWAFVRKARLSYDPGYYKLAEQCSLCVQSENADDPDAILLHGHVLDSLHKFKEAESVARKLIAIRNEAPDHGLLGDILMEQGRLDEAIVSYQKMINLRPDLQGYLRVAHVRWLKGDLEGATEVMQMAVTAGSPRESEPTAWAYTRLGIYELQSGNTEIAAKSAGIALQFAENYAAALVLRGRILLAQGKASEAIESLQRAATLNSLPEYLWTLADALREAGRSQAAQDVESRLISNGAVNDPRTFALYLVTRGQRIQQALALAEEELNTRADVFTMDAVAWALKANGRLDEARDFSEKALKEGTEDARLFYHAGSIAMALGNYSNARESFRRADQIKQTLMPSERDDLNRQFAARRELDKTTAIARGN